MNSPPDDCPRAIHGAFAWPALLLLCLGVCVTLSASCGEKLVTQPIPESKSKPAPTPVNSVPNWLGNPERNFYGTGPWQEGPLEIVWANDTDFISGRLHPDLWGGTSWPGQPSVDGTRVYFPS